MLAMVVRGVFLVGILSLYSVSLWKMIDGFFKDRFQNYLHEEFKKNPTMRADLNKYAALKANKRENDFINIENLPSAPSMSEREFDETHLSQSGSVDILTTAATFLENNNPKITEQNTLLTISVDDNNNAFQESHELQAKRNPNPMKTRTTTTTTTTGNHEQSSERTKKNGEMNDGEHGSSLDSRRIESEKRRNKGEKTIRQKRGSLLQLESNKKETKKRKYVPITFSDDDFRTAKKSFHEDDFSEFENEDEMQNEREIGGILVSELPIKPRFDIGVHEIVNADEFCPLTLEDEATCGITSKWP